MKTTMDTLQENVISALVYKNNEGKYLTCRHDFINNSIGIPMKKFEVGESQWAPYTKELIELMEFEFGVRAKSLSVISTNRISYVLAHLFVIGNCIGYRVNETPEYKGKLAPRYSPGGSYTDAAYLTFAEIKTLMRNGQFDTNSYNFICELEVGA
ncbi:MAG: hypothetical protein ACRCVH_13425 [Vagococcus fluvialis]